ncbi:MAG TPA: hypothetical protein VNR51_10785 [Hyphomicrobium sp.]|nr:hypothetical protein [Hyphomicrobium sp.]
MTPDTSADPAVTVTKTGSGYRVSANGRTEDFAVGDPSSSLRLPDVWSFQTTGRMGWQSSGVAKMRALGLTVNGQCPDPKSFFAVAGTPPSSVQPSPGLAAEYGSASLSPAPTPAVQGAPPVSPSAPNAVVQPAASNAAPDFVARMQARHGLAASPPASSEHPFVQRMRARHPVQSLDGTAAKAPSVAAEPDFVNRMKARHGVHDEGNVRQ